MMRLLIVFFVLISLTNCNADNVNGIETDSETVIFSKDTTVAATDSIKYYLALGDSYTVAESVDPEKSFPAQLVTCLDEDFQVELELIATTGWTTTDLINALDKGTQRETYDLVTLLIGVNNQYQGKSFDEFKNEFRELLRVAIQLANENKERVIVVSIPDYAYTSFGQGGNPSEITRDIDTYNDFIQKAANANGVQFVNITDITRQGLQDPNLVARDGLHPSAEAYQQFVERICPVASTILK